MSDRRSIESKADSLERRSEEENLMLEKESDELEVLEEVFDRFTREGIDKIIRRNVIDKIHGVIKAGKEARIYWGEAPSGDELAIKIYYTTTADFKRGMIKYIEGDPRFKKIQRGTRSLIYMWTQKEFKNLQLCDKANVNTPKPIAFNKNILVMTFIGSDGVPAPLLREVSLDDPGKFYLDLLSELRLLYTGARLVHGDLSEYNIMVWNEVPVIFDLSQALLVTHPISDELLQRDISNVNTYFKRLGVVIAENDKLEQWVKGGAKDLY
jgi:RIO kinase 1